MKIETHNPPDCDVKICPLESNPKQCGYYRNEKCYYTKMHLDDTMIYGEDTQIY